MAAPTHPTAPDSRRVVILGAGGFIASSSQRQLEARGWTCLGLSRQMLDLTSPAAGEELKKKLDPEDTLLFIAAQAPVKTEIMLIDNLKMAKAVCEALRGTPVRHLVYISSDAVYADSDAPLTENSCAQPDSLHGVMHLAREVMLSRAFEGPACNLRPTLVYGHGDPHNGYGPNRFFRLAQEGKEIQLFGEGEERRDHIWVEDVARFVASAVETEFQGNLNLATGEVVSFRELAEIAVKIAGRQVHIKKIARIQPMPHRGLRRFDVKKLRSTFPGICPCSIRVDAEKCLTPQ